MFPLQALKHSNMLQDELDSLKNKLEEQRNNGDFNIKSMTQEIVRMTEVGLHFLPVTLSHFTSLYPFVGNLSRFDRYSNRS